MGFEILSKHVRIEAGEERKIEAAVKALQADPHAPREVTVTLVLSVHREYPKHVVVGEDADGNKKTVIVQDAEEEARLLPAPAPAAASEPDYYQ